MTMVPAAHQDLSKDQHQHQRRNLFHGGGGCGGGGGGYGSSYGDEYCGLGSDFVVANSSSMAEDESRTNSINDSTSKDNNTNNINQEINESKSTNNNIQEQEIRDEGWLQLSIGGNTDSNSNSRTRSRSHERINNSSIDHVVNPTVDITRGGLIELDLLPGTTSSSSSRPVFHVPPTPIMSITAAAAGGGSSSFATSLYFQQQPQQQQQLHLQHEALNWGFRPIQMQYSPAPVSYFSRPFNIGADISAAGPSSTPDFRLIDPPKRPATGIWFTLQASPNQAQEPFLPQISKSYLRIKDGRMTVRLLMKYLVNKLRLDSESEVEIRCRGQQLGPLMTLQHVRDNIWRPRDAVTLLPDSSATDHIMVLHYARIPHDSHFQN